MLVKEEQLICSNHKCEAEFVVGGKPAIEKQNAHCCRGSELKKTYHPPVLRAHGTLITEGPCKC